MAEKKGKRPTGKNRPAPAARRQKHATPAPERPPESAENFEHTLRRLMIERDERSGRR